MVSIFCFQRVTQESNDDLRSSNSRKRNKYTIFFFVGLKDSNFDAKAKRAVFVFFVKKNEFGFPDRVFRFFLNKKKGR